MSEVIFINDDSIDSDTHPVHAIACEVESALSEFWQNVALVSNLESPDLREGSGATPNLSRFVDDQIQAGHFPLSLNEMFDKFHTGEEDGSSNVTAIHVLLENTVKKTIKFLCQTGQMDDLCEFFEEVREPEDPPAAFIAAYTVFTYSKGWVAEKIITDDERFSKLFITNDQKGQDVRKNDGMKDIQVKPMTTRASNGIEHFEKKTVPHAFYQWTFGGLYFIEGARDALDANDAAAKDGNISKTLIRTTHGAYKRDDGSKYRFLWW